MKVFKVPFRATTEGMKRGYWKIVDADNRTVESGLTSGSYAKERAENLNKEEPIT